MQDAQDGEQNEAMPFGLWGRAIWWGESTDSLVSTFGVKENTGHDQSRKQGSALDRVKESQSQ